MLLVIGERISKFSVGYGNHSVASVSQKKGLKSYYISSIIFNVLTLLGTYCVVIVIVTFTKQNCILINPIGETKLYEDQKWLTPWT